MRKYYFDTSIWLDLFENRDEPGLPKSRFVKELVNKILKMDGRILYSDVVMTEMSEISYPYNEIKQKFATLIKILVYVESTKTQFGKAKDISSKRKVPKRDALHALLARDNGAVMVTRDKHFNELRDITIPKKPEECLEFTRISFLAF